jgi:predicted hotdog family 3-hydroxylacyl-ACP dehydratase
MQIDQAGIRALIPHAGAMCLLDRVESWDATHIRCVTDSHHRADNPLRQSNGLRAICGVEYAAQPWPCTARSARADAPGRAPASW